MKKFIALSKFSESYYEGMVSNPQDRREAIYKLFKSANMRIVNEDSVLYCGHPDFDFVCIVYAESEEVCKAMQAMLLATGFVKSASFARAWSSEEWQNISNKASSLVGTYEAPAQYKNEE